MPSENQSNNNVNDEEILTIFSFNCDLCHKTIEIPLTRKDKENQVGGIFQKIIIHQCVDKPKAFFIYFDEHFALRQKILREVTIAKISESNGFSLEQIEDIKVKYGFNYFYKKFSEEFSKAIYAILIGQQVIIAGDKSLVSSLIHTLRIFTQIRNCKIIEWTEKVDRFADIVGTPKIDLENFPTSVIIDLDNNRIINGIQNAYAAKLLQKIMQQPDAISLTEVVSKQLQELDDLVGLFIQVKSLEEVELFLESLAIETIDESLLEILIIVGAQLNPLIAQYYRFRFGPLKELAIKKILPFKLWILNEKATPQEISIEADLITNFKEYMILDRIKTVLSKCRQVLTLYEYFTPLTHYILIPSGTQNLVFSFPRFNEDWTIIANAMKSHLFFLHEKFSPQLNPEELKQQVKTAWEKIVNKVTLPENFQHLLEIRKELPLLIEHSILESSFFVTTLKPATFRVITSKLIEMLVQKFSCEPKIIHTKQLYTISSTLSNQIPDNPKNHQTIDVHFNVHFYVKELGRSKNSVIVLDLFIDPQHMTLGLECQKLFASLFTKFGQVFSTLFKWC